MTQKHFAEQIIQTVDNCRQVGHMTDEEVAKQLCGLLNALEPRFRWAFSKWGQPHERANEIDCWPETQVYDPTEI